jgi:Spy/CpxP family protein refolding chaperone
MRHMTLGIVVSLAFLTAGFAAEPQAGPTGWERFPLVGSPVGKMISGTVGRLMVLRSEMNVTAEQKAAIRNVLVDRRPQIAETVQSVREKRLVLRNAVLSGESDEVKVRAAADELGKAIGDAAVRAVKLRNEIAPILSEEQRQLIGTFLQENDAAVDRFLDRAIERK